MHTPYGSNEFLLGNFSQKCKGSCVSLLSRADFSATSHHTIMENELKTTRGLAGDYGRKTN